MYNIGRARRTCPEMNGEESVYAAARDACAMTSFYTTTFMLHGHTGGGIGEIWRSAAMGLLHEKKPAQYREFMDNRKWHYDLSRRWDGSFGILGGARYDTTEWGAGYALTYTIPRKTLRVTGAPKTKFVHEYRLPQRPWGTKADDMFLSLEVAIDKDGKRQDLSRETLANDSSRSVLIRLTESGPVSDETLRKYAHHQDHSIRLTAARKAMGVNSNYLGWRSQGGETRPALIFELIRSKDPRVRRAGIEAMTIGLPSDQPEKYLTQEVFDLLTAMLEDPGESWWVKEAALGLVGRAPRDWLVPHADLLIAYLRHEEWWLQNAALTALAPVVADERYLYRVRVGSGQHVGSGDGYRIYINGKLLVDTKHGVGRREGARPRGGFITKELTDEFNRDEVTIAATTFLRYGNRAIVTMPAVPQGIFSLWLEEMKLPPLDDEAIRKSGTVVPMLSSEWQAKQDPDNKEFQTDSDMFRYDGRFVANPKILGSWKVIDQVKTIDEFTPEKKMNPGRTLFIKMTFKDNGTTGDGLWIWSGDTLMDLDRYQALKMTVKTIGGGDYLFIEAGGFSEKNPQGWKSALYVMKREGR